MSDAREEGPGWPGGVVGSGAYPSAPAGPRALLRAGGPVVAGELDVRLEAAPSIDADVLVIDLGDREVDADALAEARALGLPAVGLVGPAARSPAGAPATSQAWLSRDV